MTATASNHAYTPVSDDRKALASRGGMLHWTQNFSAPSVLAFISAPEKTFVKQDANEVLSAEGEQFN